MTQEVQYSDEDLPFVDILSSMGIGEFDAMVPVALNEYASRFATELLNDARSYASHAQRKDIVADDIKLALKLSDARVTGIDSMESVVNSVKTLVNQKDLTSLVDEDSVLIRYPKDMLLTRSHTYIPGNEAYPEIDCKEGDPVNARDGDETKASESNTADSSTIVVDTSSSTDEKASIGFRIQASPSARTGAKMLQSVPGFVNSS